MNFPIQQFVYFRVVSTLIMIRVVFRLTSVAPHWPRRICQIRVTPTALARLTADSTPATWCMAGRMQMSPSGRLFFFLFLVGGRRRRRKGKRPSAISVLVARIGDEVCWENCPCWKLSFLMLVILIEGDVMWGKSGKGKGWVEFWERAIAGWGWRGRDRQRSCEVVWVMVWFRRYH